MIRTSLPRVGGVLALALALLPRPVAASPPAEPVELPKGTVGEADPASKGESNLEGLDQVASAEEISGEEEDPDSLDVTELGLGLGAMLNSGNSRSFASTSTLDLRLRRGAHQFTTAVAANYGRSAKDRHDPWHETTNNLQGRLRYDGFFHGRWSAFLMTTHRHDRFQGIEYRLNVDPGVAFHALALAKHRLWFELGYDFEFEVRTEAHILEHDSDGRILLDDQGDPTQVLPKREENHAGRLFAGYANHLNERVDFRVGVEYLQSFLLLERLRVNFESGLMTHLSDRFSLNTTFTLRFDNEPAQNVEKLDTVTALQLTYRFF